MHRMAGRRGGPHTKLLVWGSASLLELPALLLLILPDASLTWTSPVQEAELMTKLDQSESCPPGPESAVAQVEGDCRWGPHDTVQRGGHERLMLLSRPGPELPWVCYFWSLDAQLFHLIQRMTQSPSKQNSSPAHNLDNIQFNTRCVIDDLLGHQMLCQIFPVYKISLLTVGREQRPSHYSLDTSECCSLCLCIYADLLV